MTHFLYKTIQTPVSSFWVRQWNWKDIEALSKSLLTDNWTIIQHNINHLLKNIIIEPSLSEKEISKWSYLEILELLAYLRSISFGSTIQFSFAGTSKINFNWSINNVLSQIKEYQLHLEQIFTYQDYQITLSGPSFDLLIDPLSNSSSTSFAFEFTETFCKSICISTIPTNFCIDFDYLTYEQRKNIFERLPIQATLQLAYFINEKLQTIQQNEQFCPFIDLLNNKDVFLSTETSNLSSELEMLKSFRFWPTRQAFIHAIRFFYPESLQNIFDFQIQARLNFQMSKDEFNSFVPGDYFYISHQINALLQQQKIEQQNVEKLLQEE